MLFNSRVDMIMIFVIFFVCLLPSFVAFPMRDQGVLLSPTLLPVPYSRSRSAEPRTGSDWPPSSVTIHSYQFLTTNLIDSDKVKQTTACSVIKSLMFFPLNEQRLKNLSENLSVI